MSASRPEAAAAILELLAERRPERTICPSEAARRLAGPGADWRGLMAPVRVAARRLAAEGRIVATQRGRRVEPDAPGPIRLGRPRPPG